jgi:hypothetical protein
VAFYKMILSDRKSFPVTILAIWQEITVKTILAYALELTTSYIRVKVMPGSWIKTIEISTYHLLYLQDKVIFILISKYIRTSYI